LVAAASANRDRPAVFVTARGRLHLDSAEATVEVGHEVVVGVVAERDRDVSALTDEPIESCTLAAVALFSGCVSIR
jgi:hypothetical protein